MISIEQPDAGTFAALTAEIDGSRCDWGSSNNEEVVPCSVRYPLFDLIAAGNDHAFLVGMRTLKCFDGGDLEDLNQSSGQYLEARPRQFLSAVETSGLETSRIVSMATGHTVVDDDHRLLRVVSERLALLGTIDDVSVQRVRQIALEALEEKRGRLERSIGPESTS